MSNPQPIPPAVNSPLNPDRPLRHGPAIRRLFLDGLIVLALAGMAEIGLRTRAPRYLLHFTDFYHTGGALRETNPDTSRGKPVAMEKPDGVYRVLCLGDSATFGTGVAAADTFAIKLAPILTERFGRPVETISAGIPAITVGDLQVALEQRWLPYHPDSVVLAVSANCASWAWIRRGQPSRVPIHDPPQPPSLARRVKRAAAELSHKFALPSFLTLNSERVLYRIGLLDHLVNPYVPLGAMPGYGWKQLSLPLEVADGSWECFRKELESFVARARELGLPLCITAMPPGFTISDLAIDNEKSIPKWRLGQDFADRVREECARLGVPYADVRSALAKAREADPRAHLFRQMDYTHLDPLGHDIAARTIGAAVPAPR